MNPQALSQYQSILDGAEGIPVFYQPWWLDAVCGKGEWGVAIAHTKGGQPAGFWPYYIKKKFWLDIGFNPPFTPMIGPHIIYHSLEQKPNNKLAYEKKTLSDLQDQFLAEANFIGIKCNPEFNNWLPLHWKKWNQSTHYTYQIPLLEKDDIVNLYNTAARADIKQVSKDITIEISDDMDTLCSLAMNSFKLQEAESVFDENAFRSLDKELKKRKLRTI